MHLSANRLFENWEILQRRSLPPCLGSQRQLVEFNTSVAPSRIVFSKNRQKAVTVGRLNEMNHLVDNHVFQEVLRLRHELRVETDVSRLLIAAPPLRFHPLQE